MVKQEAGLQSYIRPVVQAPKPAGPDGFRRRGSHLNIELGRSYALSECPCPVPTCLSHHTGGRLLSFAPVGSFDAAREGLHNYVPIRIA